MPDPRYKVARNVPGDFYVDDNCIDCDLCRSLAPACFERDEDAYVSFVFRQPAGPEQRAACEEAMSKCPVEAIGDDGS